MTKRPTDAAWRITRIYLVIGCLWILLSDRIVGYFVKDVAVYSTVSHIKGWLYVGATAALFYRLIRSSLFELDTAQQRALRGYHELAATHQALAQANQALEEHQEQLRHMALHDHLTGLPNRRALFTALSATLAGPEGSGAVFFTDLDNFKYINDSVGHIVGDELLTAISVRLREALTPRWQVFRLGGDEFVLLLTDVQAEEIDQYARQLHDVFTEPFVLSEATVHVTISTGIALYPAHGTTPETLLKRADTALNRAKEVRANSYAVFDEAMETAIKERLELDQALRRALKGNELFLHYQPQYMLATGQICGFEALLRWNCPERGIVPPAKFIPIAEQTGQIVPLGEWVLTNACGFLADLHAMGHRGQIMAVNVSVLELVRPDYVDKVTQIVAAHNLPPHCLELEITESALMESNGLAEGQLDLLRARGFRIALDDFGTGYSSLNYLRKLPITTLKIDRDFTAAIDSKAELSLVGEMIRIGKMMGLSVVAEGVENERQAAFLAEHQCDKAQGFLFSAPVAPEEAVAKLRAGR